MISALQIFISALFLLALSYYLLIAVFTWGWFRQKPGFEPDAPPQTKVSVVIALRNESDNITRLLERLESQIYPKEWMEVVLVDDHSTDNTVKLVEEFKKNNPSLNIQLVHAVKEGKKSAVKQGVEKSAHDFILTTDGDCQPGKWWVRKMTAYYEKYNPSLILGPVVYDGERTLWQKMFSLEFISLVASGAGAAGAGFPFMGNAANMGFVKKVYQEDRATSRFASGDDVFLIHSIKKARGRKAIRFLKDATVTVKTSPPDSLKAFFFQRLRWGSKAKGYHDIIALFTSFLVFVFNVGLFAMFFVSMAFHWLFAVWMLFLLLKTLVDFPLLQGYARLTGKTKLLWLVLPLEMLYPFYITFTGIAALFFQYKWKGRKNLQ